MSWVVIGDKDRSCFGCNTTDVVFGKLFSCSVDELEKFGQSLPEDPRHYSTDELEDLYLEWKHTTKGKEKVT